MKQNYEEDYSGTSKFNAGMLQMQRIHTLQDTVNRAKINPLALNEEVGVYNYEIIISCTTSLYQECCPKLKPDDKKKVEEVIEKIDSWLIDSPFFKQTTKRLGNPETKFEKISWRYFNKLLFIYENLVRDMIEKVGMNSPPEDESALF